MSNASPNRPIRGLILDMDGVLWRADQPIGDLPATFDEFDRRGLRVALATNNSTLSPQQYLAKLARFGVHLEPWQIVNSSQTAARYLKGRFPSGGPVYVVGEQGLLEALEEQGFQPVDKLVEGTLAVVAGIDRALTYSKLSQATTLIRSGLPFIGTNGDRTYPTPTGLVPGAGSILAAIEVASDVAPTIVGKPAPAMYEVALERLGLTPAETLVVGDRIETDIVGAQALGCRTALVLSGVTSETQARAFRPAPDWILPDLAHVLQVL